MVSAYSVTGDGALQTISRPYMFCASIPPASVATALEALTILEEQPELPQRLISLSNYMREGLKAAGLHIKDSVTPIIPIYTKDAITTLETWRELYEDGVYTNPVLPPATTADACLLRTSYMASHTKEILDEALSIIERTVKKHVGE